MSALREQEQRQRSVYARARKLLGEEQQALDRLRGDHASAAARWIAGEVEDDEMEACEAEIEAVKVRVRRFAAVVEETRPPSTRLPAS